jgi:PadR family transcriptional regulator, regulatory protein PadR
MGSTPSENNADLLENLRIELRSGCLAVAAMSQLHHEHYGYSLRQALVEVGLEIEESTLYPLLRRLESQGLLVSEWREEGRRKKRFYKLSPRGARVLDQLLIEWKTINNALARLIGKAA